MRNASGPGWSPSWRRRCARSIVIVFPTARTVAPPIGVDRTLGGAFYNRALNLTGSPALSVCNGFGDHDMPTSLQIVGRPFEDPLVLRVGAAYERATGWRSRRPDIAHAA